MSEEQEKAASAKKTDASTQNSGSTDAGPMVDSAPENRVTRGKSPWTISLLVLLALLAIAIFALMRAGTDPEVEVVQLGTEGGFTSAKIKVPPRSSSPEVAVQAVATPAPASAAPPLEVQAPAETARFQLVTQQFLSAAELTSALKLLEQQGYDVRRSEKNKTLRMTRLLVGHYTRKLAERRLAEVLQYAEGAFLVAGSDNKFDLYAGSFASLDHARRAADYLYQRGVRVEERSIEIALPQTRLRFGRFASREQARQAADRLLKAGLVPVQVEALP